MQCGAESREGEERAVVSRNTSERHSDRKEDDVSSVEVENEGLGDDSVKSAIRVYARDSIERYDSSSERASTKGTRRCVPLERPAALATQLAHATELENRVERRARELWEINERGA